MKRFHIALSTDDLSASVPDYSARLGVEPELVVEEQYALWRTETLNFSLRVDSSQEPGQLRHLGWEDPSASSFTEETDANGIVWECFSAEQQLEEIQSLWPGSG